MAYNGADFAARKIRAALGHHRPGGAEGGEDALLTKCDA